MLGRNMQNLLQSKLMLIVTTFPTLIVGMSLWEIGNEMKNLSGLVYKFLADETLGIFAYKNRCLLLKFPSKGGRTQIFTFEDKLNWEPLFAQPIDSKIAADAFVALVGSKYRYELLCNDELHDCQEKHNIKEMLFKGRSDDYCKDDWKAERDLVEATFKNKVPSGEGHECKIRSVFDKKSKWYMQCQTCYGTGCDWVDHLASCEELQGKARDTGSAESDVHLKSSDEYSDNEPRQPPQATGPTIPTIELPKEPVCKASVPQPSPASTIYNARFMENLNKAAGSRSKSSDVCQSDRPADSPRSRRRPRSFSCAKPDDTFELPPIKPRSPADASEHVTDALAHVTALGSPIGSCSPLSALSEKSEKLSSAEVAELVKALARPAK